MKRTFSTFLVLVAFAAATAIGPSATGDLVGHWRFDERAGLLAADELGLNHGTLLGGAQFAPGEGVDGGAIRLSRSTNGIVDIGPAFGFTGQQPFTISAWVKFEFPGQTTPESFIVGRHRSTIVAGYILSVGVSGGAYGAPGKAWLYQSNSPGGEPVSTTSVNDGDWHHVVGVHNENSLTLIYVDGAPAEGTKGSLPIAPIGVSTLIGGIHSAGGVPVGFFDGLIDDVQMYDHALDCRSVERLFKHPGQPISTKSADLDGDGIVDGADLGALLNAWGPCAEVAGCAADLDCNGVVDGADLGLLLNEWTI